MNKKLSVRQYLCIHSKLIFWSTISGNGLQSKIIYLSYSKMRGLKTIKIFYDLAR